VNTLGLVLVVGPIALLLYSYAGYPLLLVLMSRLKRVAPPASEPPAEWPHISITVPVYNERHQISTLLESLLKLDYPAERRQILIVSDASTDGTDDIVRSYADRGIEFLRMPGRKGKTASENAAAQLLRGEIVVNTDASIRIYPDAIKPLVRVFSDPTIGAASGRDVSVARVDGDANGGEAGYVGYEMGVRDLETRVHGIVGASGCFYAIRTHLHRVALPDSLSRDFAAALITRAHGYRTVSVNGALCAVPRTTSLGREYRRKVRTITRGIETLAHLRHLLNPLRFGVFSWMLFSHKVCRWLVPWGIPFFLMGLLVLSASHPRALWVLGLSGAGLAVAGASWAVAVRRPLPRVLTLPAFALAGNVAAMRGAMRALSGDRNATWEPTRRDAVAEPTRAG
jgi:cellulose synthase/poly-beta-1,6-N-acetylglucosamine synthase-like glycosyltransferase